MIRWYVVAFCLWNCSLVEASNGVVELVKLQRDMQKIDEQKIISFIEKYTKALKVIDSLKGLSIAVQGLFVDIPPATQLSGSSIRTSLERYYQVVAERIKTLLKNPWGPKILDNFEQYRDDLIDIFARINSGDEKNNQKAVYQQIFSILYATYWSQAAQEITGAKDFGQLTSRMATIDSTFFKGQEEPFDQMMVLWDPSDQTPVIQSIQIYIEALNKKFDDVKNTFDLSKVCQAYRQAKYDGDVSNDMVRLFKRLATASSSELNLIGASFDQKIEALCKDIPEELNFY